MKKNFTREELLLKIASAAYCFQELGYYGSKEQALKALLKRKGFNGYSPKSARIQFEQALKIIVEAGEFITVEIKRNKPLTQRTEDEVRDVLEKLREFLAMHNPSAPKVMIQYALNWIYTNYYLR